MSKKLETVFTLETVYDPIVESTVIEFKERSSTGQQKYGYTLENNNHDDFFQHLKEELMDATVYITKLQMQKEELKNELVLFGNYLLSDNRNSNLNKVTDADLENYKLNNK